MSWLGRSKSRFCQRGCAAAKAARGNLLVNDSVTSTEYLRQRKLLDEYRHLVFPLVLGSSKRLFILKEEQLTCNWVAAATTSVGVQLLAY
jgi:hypothetical protein